MKKYKKAMCIERWVLGILFLLTAHYSLLTAQSGNEVRNYPQGFSERALKALRAEMADSSGGTPDNITLKKESGILKADTSVISTVKAVSDTVAWLKTDTQTNFTNKAANLFIDYSFEHGSPAVSGFNNKTAADNNYWEWRRAVDDYNIVIKDSTVRFDGNYVAKIDTNTGDISYYLWLNASASTQYTFSYYRKSIIEGGGSGQIRWVFDYKLSDGTSAGSALTWYQNITSTQDWNKQDTTFTTPAGTAYLRVYLNSTDVDWDSATVYIDFIDLREGATTPDYVNTKDSRFVTDNQENWRGIKHIDTDYLDVRQKFKFFIDPHWTQSGSYRNPFTIFDAHNEPVFWVDTKGNPWIGEGVQFVTKGTLGASAMHIGHELNWDHFSWGTTRGVVWYMYNTTGSFKKLTLKQRNQTDSTFTSIMGNVSFEPSNTQYTKTDCTYVFHNDRAHVIIDTDSTVIRNQLRYSNYDGLPAAPKRNQIVILNNNPFDQDSIAIFNDLVWRYWISDSVAFESETSALLARMTTAPSAARQTLMNNIISALKIYGIWQKLDVLYVFANDTADSGQKLFLNWIGDYSNATNVNNVTIAPDTGISSNGSNSYLNTNWAPADSINFGRDDACAFIYSRTNNAGNLYDYGSFGGGTYYTAARIKRDNGQTYYQLNEIEFSASAYTGESTGLFSMSLIPGDTRIRLYRNGSEIGNSGTGTRGLPTTDLYICCLHNSTGNPAFFTTRQYSAWGIGAGLTEAQQVRLSQILEYYFDALGVGVIN